MAKRSGPPPASDEQVRALLERYNCPAAFHEVRTRFLGNITSPVMSASPLEVVKGLWGGELPPFDTMDDVNELLGALVMGLWNRLSRHQDRSNPFRLTVVVTEATRESLCATAMLRRQEVDGFAEGLFGSGNDVDLPERADEGMTRLADLRAMFVAIADVTSDPTKPATEKDLKLTRDHVRELTSKSASVKSTRSCSHASGRAGRRLHGRAEKRRRIEGRDTWSSIGKTTRSTNFREPLSTQAWARRFSERPPKRPGSSHCPDCLQPEPPGEKLLSSPLMALYKRWGVPHRLAPSRAPRRPPPARWPSSLCARHSRQARRRSLCRDGRRTRRFTHFLIY